MRTHFCPTSQTPALRIPALKGESGTSSAPGALHALPPPPTPVLRTPLRHVLPLQPSPAPSLPLHPSGSPRPLPPGYLWPPLCSPQAPVPSLLRAFPMPQALHAQLSAIGTAGPPPVLLAAHCSHPPEPRAQAGAHSGMGWWDGTAGGNRRSKGTAPQEP